ncbi:MAG TPA: DUF2249 domain-containing protein [Acidiphilium sp.]
MDAIVSPTHDPDSGTGPSVTASATALARLNRLFVVALLAMARAGDGEQACRLAADGWSALRHVNEREAERLTAALHTLARAASTPPGRNNEEKKMADSQILDVRDRIPMERHRAIFESYGKLGKGDAFVLVNDHDPKPLYYQFDAEHHGEFTWKYLEEGPQVWRVEIGKTNGAHKNA